MEISKQCVSLELAKRLKKLNVPQNSIFWWNEGDGIEDRIEYIPEMKDFSTKELVSAFTSSELGEMLPWDIVIARNINKEWLITFQADRLPENKSITFISENLTDAVAKMLIHLIEQEIIKI